MTFSIVGRSADGQAFGVAVASKFLAVGAVVPAAQARVGAIATQSYANLAYRPDGLALLRAGRSASDTLDELTAADEQRENRQAGVVDASGAAATFSGSGCQPWAGGATGPGTRSRATSSLDPTSWPRWSAPGWPPARTNRWPAGCTPHSPPEMRPAGTGAAGRARRYSW